MKIDLRHFAVILLYPLIIFIAACAPCRPIVVDSYPPGAFIYVYRPEYYGPRAGLEEEGRWQVIGQTPLQTDSCHLSAELRARWEEEMIFLSDYHGQERVWFDFEKGTASAGD